MRRNPNNEAKEVELEKLKDIKNLGRRPQYYPSPKDLLKGGNNRQKALSAALAVGAPATVAGVGWYLLKCGLLTGAIGGAGAVGGLLIGGSLWYDTKAGHLAKTNEFNAKKLGIDVAPTTYTKMRQRAKWMKMAANVGILATAAVGILAAIGLTITTAGVGTIITVGLLSAGLRLLASREQFIYQDTIKNYLSSKLQESQGQYDNIKLKTAMTLSNNGPDYYSIRKFFEDDRVKVALGILAGAALLAGIAFGGWGLLALGGVAVFVKAAGLIGFSVLCKGVQQEYQTRQLAVNNESAGHHLKTDAPRTQSRMYSRGNIMKRVGQIGIVAATFLGVASAIGLSVASFGVGAIIAGGIAAAALYFLGAREQRLEQEYTKKHIEQHRPDNSQPQAFFQTAPHSGQNQEQYQYGESTIGANDNR